MAIRKVYIGSIGPFLYDDAEPINDPDGDFLGENYHGLITDGAISPSASGYSGAITVVTQIQAGGGGAIGIQYKNRALTFANGSLDVVGAESAWIDV